MSAGWLKIATEGIQDIYIHGKPDISYFQTVYKAHSSFLLNTFEIPFNNPPLTSGGTAICRIPYKGDLLRSLSLKVNLPPAYTPGSGWVRKTAYPPSIKFFFKDGTSLEVYSVAQPNNIYATYNFISNVQMLTSNVSGTVSNGMYIYGTPYTGLVNVADNSDLQYITANLSVSQYTLPVQTLTHINFANLIANASTQNITNSNLYPFSNVLTIVAGMNIFSTSYTGNVNINSVTSTGIYTNLTSQQPISMVNKTVYFSNIVTTYSTTNISNVSVSVPTSNISNGMIVYNSGYTGVVTANVIGSNSALLTFPSQQPASINTSVTFLATSNISTNTISQVNLTFSNTFGVFSSMNIYNSGITGVVNVFSVNGNVVTANITSQQPFSLSGSLYVSNIIANLNVSNISNCLFDFVNGPTVLSFGNVYGLSFAANVNYNYLTSVNLNFPSQQPFVLSTTNILFSTTTSNLSTSNITTSQLILSSATGAPFPGQTFTFSSGGYTGSPLTVTDTSQYPLVTVTFPSQQPKSFSSLTITYGSYTALAQTANITSLTLTVSNISAATPSTTMYTNIYGSSGITGGYFLPYFGQVQNVTSYSAPNLVISFPAQQPVSFTNLWTVYGFSSAQIKTSNITTAVCTYSNVIGNIASATNLYLSGTSQYVTSVDTANTSIYISFPQTQPFTKSSTLTYFTPLSSYTFTTSNITSANVYFSNSYASNNYSTLTVSGMTGTATVSGNIITFTAQQPFSLTNAIATYQNTIVTTTTTALTTSNISIAGTLISGMNLVLSNYTSIGWLTNISGGFATLVYNTPTQPASVSGLTVYPSVQGTVTTNLLTTANLTISNIIGSRTIQAGSNLLGLPYTGIVTAKTANTGSLLQVTLSTPQQPQSFTVPLMYSSDAQADFTSPSSIPWLNQNKLTAQNVTILYNTTQQKWNFLSTKPIANLAFVNYENMVFWGFDPHNKM